MLLESVTLISRSWKGTEGSVCGSLENLRRVLLKGSRDEKNVSEHLKDFIMLLVEV